MRLPEEFQSRGVQFTTARTTPWEPKIETWVDQPHFTVECYNLWADGRYLGVIYKSMRDEEVWYTLQLSKENHYPAYEGEIWLEALEDYLTEFTNVEGLAMAS